MKKKFSAKWRASKQKRKQRKYRANAPLHIKQKMLKAGLSKELRKKYGRTVGIRRGDSVKIISGKNKGKKGTVSGINKKKMKIEIEGLNIIKKDGSKVPVRFDASNLQITELNLEDKRRFEGKKTVEKQGEERKD